jgi:hypothetical protein
MHGFPLANRTLIYKKMPALVAGAGQYDTWDTLMLAVFGVSTAEFETGWHAYLDTYYGAVSAD